MQEPEYEQMNAQERVSMIWMTDVLLKRFYIFSQDVQVSFSSIYQPIGKTWF